MAKRTRWMMWTCPKCGKEKISGQLKQCPNCGANSEGKWISNPQNPTITDPTELAEAESGPNWKCGYCEALNPDGTQTCRNCGGAHEKGSTFDSGVSLGFTDERVGEVTAIHTLTPNREERVEYTTSGIPSSVDTRPSYTPPSYSGSVQNRDSPWAPRESFWERNRGIILFFIFMAIVGSVVYFLTRTQEVTATVSGFEWRRTITIQQYAWVEESNLVGCPAGSRGCDPRYEQIGSHQEEDGFNEYTTQSCDDKEVDKTCREECVSNGNGSESCDDVCEPVYENVCVEVKHKDQKYKTVPDYGYRYYFQIQRWVYSRDVRTANTDRKPLWGETNLGSVGLPEQESGRSEVYTIRYITREEEPRSYSRDVSYSEWIEYDEKATYTLVINRLNMLVEVKRVD